MTTIVNFTPSSSSNFSFNATLDKQVYKCVITWNLFGNRYYINVYSTGGILIFSKPLVGSPLGYYLSSLSVQNNIATAVTIDSHTFTVGSEILLVISQNTPTGYNGTFLCTVTSRNSFTYPLAAVLPVPSQTGIATWNNSLTAGYFDSTLTYFPDSQQFVINP